VSEGIIRIALNPDDDKLAKYKQPVYEYEIQSNWSASADNETGGLARNNILFFKFQYMLTRIE
jgi:hypothetical protein